ncbi:MAG: hypothetical protein K2H36_01100, partial [Clostridia bacterium]|nr:hypothetical protein [Clostridia bacterium]
NVSIKPYIKNYLKDNKLFIITFYGLFLAVFAISLFIVLNYDSELTHKNYYRILMNGEYGYVKITLKYFLFNLLLAFCAMLTYRKKYAFAIMYFVVTFIAYRLAVNIVGSWDANLLISILNAVLFYFMIYLIFVITIVTITCYINKNYLYCSGNCPITLKKMIGFTLIVSVITGIAISIFTAILPLILCHILF